MRITMRVAMCIDPCIRMRVDTSVDVCTDMGGPTCASTRAGTCLSGRRWTSRSCASTRLGCASCPGRPSVCSACWPPASSARPACAHACACTGALTGLRALGARRAGGWTAVVCRAVMGGAAWAASSATDASRVAFRSCASIRPAPAMWPSHAASARAQRVRGVDHGVTCMARLQRHGGARSTSTTKHKPACALGTRAPMQLIRSTNQSPDTHA